MAVPDLDTNFRVVLHRHSDVDAEDDGAARSASSFRVSASIDDRLYSGVVAASGDGGSLTVFVDGEVAQFELADADSSFVGAKRSSAVLPECNAPMSGRIVKVMVAVGDRVQSGAPLIIMESMKMEHLIRSTADGTIQSINVDVGQSVAGGQALIKLGAAAGGG